MRFRTRPSSASSPSASRPTRTWPAPSRALHERIGQDRAAHRADAAFLVQEFVAEGVEVFAGVSRDPDFGLSIAFGLGGIAIEIMRDFALRMLPLREGDAEAMIAETRAAQCSARCAAGPPPTSRALAACLYALADFAWHNADAHRRNRSQPDQGAARGRGCVVVDALIVDGTANARMTVGYLRLRNVVKSYDGKSNAVDDVSIDIARGEFVTFLGPSGSGKTTTLMMIAGFETPTAGVIELGGRDLTLSKPYQRNIGMVFQNYALFPHMTAAKNVVFPLQHARASRATRSRRAPGRCSTSSA